MTGGVLPGEVPPGLAADEDVAAVLAVLGALAAAGRPTSVAVRSVWSSRRTVAGDRTWSAGPDLWWASGLPR